jgi:hypothetical protein
MLTLKHYLTNLHFQTNLLISFFLENSSLLSNEIISLMDKSQLEFHDLIEIKGELESKLNCFENIETICKHPRYFNIEKPSELIQFYSSKECFRKNTYALNTFLAYANSFAQAMHKANLNIIENLPPLYQSILNHSRKNRREGFRETLVKIVYENPYPDILTAEYIRITTLIADLSKSKTALNYFISTLEQQF